MKKLKELMLEVEKLNDFAVTLPNGIMFNRTNMELVTWVSFVNEKNKVSIFEKKYKITKLNENIFTMLNETKEDIFTDGNKDTSHINDIIIGIYDRILRLSGSRYTEHFNPFDVIIDIELTYELIVYLISYVNQTLGNILVVIPEQPKYHVSRQMEDFHIETSV